MAIRTRLLLYFVQAGLCFASLSPAAVPTLTVEPKAAEQGSAAFLRITSPGPEDADRSLLWGDETMRLLPCPDDKEALCTALPVAFDSATGPAEATYVMSTEDSTQEATATLTVKSRAFKKARLRVARKKATPPPEVEERIQRERQLMAEMVKNSPKEALCEGGYAHPVISRITAPFGEQRVFNKKLETVHLGVDLRANERTAILSANAGIVVLAREMYYAGRLVVVDHGNNIFTGYAHLSKFAVQEGQKVARGQAVGQAGRSGRVTGPHLHWTLRIGDTLVDPLASIDVVSRLCRGNDPDRKASSLPMEEPAPGESTGTDVSCSADTPCDADEATAPTEATTTVAP